MIHHEKKPLNSISAGHLPFIPFRCPLRTLHNYNDTAKDDVFLTAWNAAMQHKNCPQMSLMKTWWKVTNMLTEQQILLIVPSFWILILQFTSNHCQCSNIVKILLGLAKSYFNVKSGSSPAIQVSPVPKIVFLKFRNSNNLFTITRAGTRLAQKKTKTTKTTWTGPWPSSGTCSSLGRSRRRSLRREATTASRTTSIQAERRTRAMSRWFCLFSPETGMHVFLRSLDLEGCHLG